MLTPRGRNQEVLILKPDPAGVVIIGVILSPGVVLGIISWIYRVEVLYGTLILLGAALIWASLATIRIKLHGKRLERWVFWHRKWAIDLDDAMFKEGVGGDIPILPAIIVTRRSTGKKVGEILTRQFRARDLSALKEALASAGAEVVTRRRGR